MSQAVNDNAGAFPQMASTMPSLTKAKDLQLSQVVWLSVKQPQWIGSITHDWCVLDLEHFQVRAVPHLWHVTSNVCSINYEGL